jgi:DNA-binding IclR family transcriptional regulator
MSSRSPRFIIGTNGSTVGVRTLAKGLRVLESLAKTGSRGIGLGELSNRLNVHKVTVHRFLLTLQTLGYVVQDAETDRYHLGVKVLDLASTFLADLELRDVARPFLEDLSRSTRETVHTVMLDCDEVVTIDRIEGEHPIVLRTQVGARRPMHCTATGKSMLAFLPEEDIGRILGSGLPRLTPQTVTDATVLQAVLQEVRLRGFALDNEEYAEGIRCAAAPVFDHTGRVVGAISLSVPVMRSSMEQLTAWAELVRSASARVSQRLGFRALPLQSGLGVQIGRR